MKWIEQFDLFLLDLDGLLVDTEKLHFQAYQKLCKKHGYDLSWDLEQYMQIAHESSDGLKKAIFPHLALKQKDWDILYKEKKKFYTELLESGQLTLMPGVENFLKALADSRVKRCVATHSSKEHVDFIRKNLPLLNTIPVWITREDYLNPKPAPDAYLKAIELLADSEDVIVGFEDSLRGIEALMGTRALPILICNSNHPQMRNDLLKGIKHFSSFSEIPNTFKPLKKLFI